MKILAVGGGSGGHVTPVVAVLRELRALHPQAEIRFWSDVTFGDQAISIMAHSDTQVKVSKIVAGKLRRYYNLSMWRQLARPFSIVLPNIRDLFLVGVGTIQSIVKLIAWRPDVVFTKGGYVCLPVGFAAHLLRIPLVVHDSDAHPGLTNRILSRWASAIATGSPVEYYPYPKSITRYVGIPVAPEFTQYDEEQKKLAKVALGFRVDAPLVVVTGGGLGAVRINTGIEQSLDQLLPITQVALVAGSNQYDELRSLTPENDARFQLLSFIPPQEMAMYMGAADIVVTRAGATTLLELAAMAKPIILVPNGHLTGGHQLKNAAVYKDDDELDAEPHLLLSAISRLLRDPKQMTQLSHQLSTFAKPEAAHDVAEMILSVVK
jgi:UDP-N-acetylglucosamine--N-acetylmuramyl-(pentapeptide) pyrophosphoryl-undecaprenol N-acetylglucosamine transferase